MNDFPIIKDINKFIESTERVKYTIYREKENLNQGFLDFDKLDLDFDNPRQVLMGDKRVKKPPLKETSRKAIKSTFNNAIKKYRQNWYENIYQKYPKGKVVRQDDRPDRKAQTLANFPNTRLGDKYGFMVRNEDSPSMIIGLKNISKLLDIVKSADFEEFLKQNFKNQNTLRNYYSAVIYFLEQVKQEDKPKKTQQKFNTLREEINNSLGEKVGQLTERQKENALPQEKLQKEIVEKINPLIDEIEKIEVSDDTDITPKQLTAYKYFVILTTYMILPMRNELATIKSGLYSEYQEQTTIDKKTKGLKGKDVNRPYLEGNWYLIDTDKKKSYLLFNRYKTDGKYGARLIELPADLTRMYNRYITITNNQKNQPVFNMTNNALSTFMGRQGLKYFGKRITPNLLRTIYYSGKYQPQSFRSFTEMSKALKADGKTQGTSVSTLIRSYIKDIGKKDKVLKNDPKPSKDFKKTLRGKKPANYEPVQTLEEAKAQDLVEE